MAARILAFPKPGAFPAPVQSTHFRVDSRASVLTEGPSKRTTEMEPESMGEGLGCFRGTLHIFLLEGATAALIYGAWHLAHMLR